MADRATPLRAELISVVSHELRTPLTSIASLIEMIEDGRLAGPDRDGAMASIRRNTERLLTLVEDLNLLANLESAGPVAGGAADLPGLVHGAARRHPMVRVEVPAGPPVPGDPALLARLMCLVIGAVSGVAADGAVTVTGAVEASGWTVTARGYAAGLGGSERLLTPGTQQQLQIIHATIEGGGHGGEQLYALHCDTEFAYVLTGGVEVVMEDDVVTLGTGDAMTFPGRTPHTWRNASATEVCEVLWVLSPAP